MKNIVLWTFFLLSRFSIAHDSPDAPLQIENSPESKEPSILNKELKLIRQDIINAINFNNKKTIQYNMADNTSDFWDRILYLQNMNLLEENHLINIFYSCLFFNYYEGVKIILSMRPNFSIIKFKKGYMPLYVALRGFIYLRSRGYKISEDIILSIINFLCINGAYGRIDPQRFILLDLARNSQLTEVVKYLEKNYMNINKPPVKPEILINFSDAI